MKKFILFIALTTSIISMKATEIEELGVDCFAFADAAMGTAGDAGDFDTWWDAFVYCSGVDPVVID